MPIKIPNKLPAYEVLTRENIFVMTEDRAVSQDIRPLQILLLNLMPKKIETETQISRILGNTPLQVELNLIATKSYVSKNTPQEHMLAFYQHFDDVKDRKFDGMIITGAPLEQKEFEAVDYWDELCQIMEWSKTHVHSTIYICWGAQAGLYYHYGVKKHLLPKKLSGVYSHRALDKKTMLLRGFDDCFYVPHSRYAEVKKEEVEQIPQLRVVSYSEQAGVHIVMTENGHQIFISGHSEYDADTLRNEYLRDIQAGINPEIPENYFPDNDPEKEPIVNWRSHANLLFSNWLNYFVYQSTPYDLDKISKEICERYQ